MKKPRIAIPEPTSKDIAYNERSWPMYAAAVEESGGEAVKIPLDLSPADTARLVSGCEGVLLPGSGADVDPEKYGEARQEECGEADPAREAVDELLMQDAANLHKPLLGICYGLQSWNVWRGGTLIQHLATGVNHRPGREVREAHAISVQPGSRLAAIVGASGIKVNSSHHQAIATPGDGLRIVARSSDDQVIEALEGTGEQFVLAVQWHPERTFDEASSKAIIGAFVQASADWEPRAIRESVAE